MFDPDRGHLQRISRVLEKARQPDSGRRLGVYRRWHYYQNLWVGLYLGRIIFPGWGNEQALVAEVVGRLKARQRLRGDTGQIRRSEHDAIILQEINNKLDCIICHLYIHYGN